ncbi:ATP-binding protein [Maribacter sp. 2210JD10-5]|uniref:hybrid sensor histidine kinase/response regulator n=1 Tax=Maribacter sp. 2210JD10-5 TaxID=3386272 RepID=UPI0039BC87D0
MNRPKNTFTIKILLSYLLLIGMALVASFYIYSEIRQHLTNNIVNENDTKLLQTSTTLTQLYESESLSRLALQSKKKKDFMTYARKIDSIYIDIDALKTLTESEQQHLLLDSLKILLKKKVANNELLRNLKKQNQASIAIDSALKEFDAMEASLGIITPEGLAPNFADLPPKAQETIKKVAMYLNENVPKKGSEQLKTQRFDSILRVSKNLLKQVQEEKTLNQNTAERREIAINKNDLELSRKLRSILSSFEQEIMINGINDNIKKEAALKKSIRLAITTALLGFLVVALFAFILNRDFWKAHLYRKKLEKEKKYSESLLTSREQLIATVSHDLRTPLNAISGYSELIEETGPSSKQKEYVAYIKSAADYVNNLVNDLLDFSRLEAGKMTISLENFNLSKLLTETAHQIAANYDHKNIKLVLDIDSVFEKPIISDAFRIRQIVSNLIGNAYKFTQEGEITITANLVDKKDKNYGLSVSVSDTGIGISKEKQPLIFKEFTQGEEHTVKKYGGYGLGLTISKKLSQLLNGTLSLKSNPGEGSVFTLEIPFEFSETTTVENPRDNSQDVLTGLTVILFDDDTTFLQLIGELLEKSGMETKQFSSFNDFSSADAHIQYDIVLTDIEMPDITGFEIVDELKTNKYKSYTDQPIIAMTGRQDIKKEVFLSHGFSAILRKPFDKTALLHTLHSLLSKDFKIPENTVQKTHGTDTREGYSLEILTSFLGDDKEALDNVLHTFLMDTKANMAALENALSNNDYDILQKTAHRMLPMFKQLKAQSCVPILAHYEIAEPKTASLEKLKEDLCVLEERVAQLEKSLLEELTIYPDHSG